MSRLKRLSKQDEMMRRDGLVTAVEVSEATGLALSAVHRGIDEKRIPGKKVKVSAKYSHWYVDIKAFVKAGNYADAETIASNLDGLVQAVAHARAEPRAKSTPRAASS